MAQKRMFSLALTDTDVFQDMPTSSQALYFHLGMHGDDDGFVDSPRKIARAAGCNEDDLRVLVTKGFVIPFNSGIVVIRDWRINNTLKNDRYRETLYQKEKAMLGLDEANRYTLGTSLEPDRNQIDSKLEPEHNIAEQNLTKQREERADKPPVPVRSGRDKKKFGEYGWVRLTDEEYNRLLTDLGEKELERCVRYINESAQGNGNKNRWKDWNLVVRRCSREKWGIRSGQESSNPFLEMLAEEEPPS